MKWSAAHIDYPHAHGLRCSYPHPGGFVEKDAATYDAAQEELSACRRNGGRRCRPAR